MQYHPEAGPGPHDALHLFDRFLDADPRLMPRRDDIHRIMILGSGPIVIGQAAEFDYSGAQACKVLAEEGYEVILVNSNPATIMTDPEFAAVTYIEPLLPGPVAQIIARERPDALLPTLGGQTALNLAKALHENGTLERHGVELIGADYDAIRRAEDRDLFRETMLGAGLRVPRSAIATSVAEAFGASSSGSDCRRSFAPPSHWAARAAASRAPTIEYEAIVAGGIAASPIGQVLVEESVLGWGEFELEVMRDRNDNVVIVCSIENVDPMGVHTGDSVTVAPQQSLSDETYQRLRDQTITVIRAVGVETGGANVQFAVDPHSGRDRRDRDEPAGLALVGARLQGDRLSDRQDRRPPRRRLCARGDRQRHHARHAGQLRADDRLRRRQVASLRVREVPWRRRRADDAHEVGRRVDGDRANVRPGVHEGDALARARCAANVDVALEELLERVAQPGASRYDELLEALRRGATIEQLSERTAIDRWFLHEFAALAADPQAPFAGVRSFRSVDTCAAEFAASTPYYYSAWERPDATDARHEVRRGSGRAS